jgi:hypothetical protein
MNDDVKNFLVKVQEIQDKKIPIKIISKEKILDSCPLTFKQQKELISTITEPVLGPLKFQKLLNQIVVDNTGDITLKTIDKLPVILRLRQDSIGEKFKIGESEGKISDILSKEYPKFIYGDTILGDVEILVEIPSLIYENQIIQSSIEYLKSSNDIGKNITDLYTYEIVKYVKSIKFENFLIEFSEIPFKDRVEIINNLSVKTNQKIADFIQNVKKIESDWLTIDIDGEEKVLDVDVSFFNS